MKTAVVLGAILMLLAVLWQPAHVLISRHGDGEVLGGPLARHGDGEVLGGPLARHGDGEVLGGPMARHGDGEVLGMA